MIGRIGSKWLDYAIVTRSIGSEWLDYAIVIRCINDAIPSISNVMACTNNASVFIQFSEPSIASCNSNNDITD